MIGNDIVDLKLAATIHRWQETRFLLKICCDQERKLITNSSDPFLCLWRFWTMKESAYKAYKRISPRSTFSPSSYLCTPISEKSGSVIYKKHHFSTTTVFQNKLIYTFISDHSSKSLINKVLSYDRANHQYLKEQIYQNLKLELSELLRNEPDQIQLKKNANGIPFVYIDNQKLPISISISHHGRFGAFCIAL